MADTSKQQQPGLRGIRGLSLRQIEVFHAVYTTRSISAASRLLVISQPVVSRTLKRIEDVLSLTLFRRGGTGLMPTVEAQLIFAEVDGLMRRVEGLGARIEEIASGASIPFRLGATASVARALVPRGLSALGAGATRPELFFDVLAVDQIVDYLLDGTGQCVVTLAQIDHPMLHSEPLGHGHLVAVVPVGHPLADRPHLAPGDFDGVDVITFQVDGPHQRAIRGYFGSAMAQLQSRTVVRFADTAVAMAAEGMAVALVDSFTTMGPIGEDVVARPLRNAPEFTLYLQTNPNRPASHHVSELRDHLLQALRRTEEA
ncbi:LysR family transcriptional regulator [Salipiger mangrovisoli]|uniref:LysR family transcriptional regulator n=1 Tax=Salipiger mangrovisoli TaxID=2865933 RepID=A0ABR9X507_9RHOB|nr:LysR family transcriptional regulator [Salipiger mangrovisoli]MBE9638631.1 LysR family transcriptional regulator [Salipiger mangrovisoli]